MISTHRGYGHTRKISLRSDVGPKRRIIWGVEDLPCEAGLVLFSNRWGVRPFNNVPSVVDFSCSFDLEFDCIHATACAYILMRDHAWVIERDLHMLVYATTLDCEHIPHPEQLALLFARPACNTLAQS